MNSERTTIQAYLMRFLDILLVYWRLVFCTITCIRTQCVNYVYWLEYGCLLLLRLRFRPGGYIHGQRFLLLL